MITYYQNTTFSINIVALFYRYWTFLENKYRTETLGNFLSLKTKTLIFQILKRMSKFNAIGLILSLSCSLSVQSVIEAYDSGIRFESRQYPGWFIGFDEELIKRNLSSGLYLFSDSITTNKTLWYIEKNAECNTEHGYFIRSMSFPNYYLNVNDTKLVLANKGSSSTCFQLIPNESYESGDWFDIELPKASSVGLKKGKKELVVATTNSIYQDEVWALKYNGLYFIFFFIYIYVNTNTILIKIKKYYINLKTLLFSSTGI